MIIDALVILGLFILVALWVLLPLIPAIMIYKRFPEAPLAATGPLATGPLANLTVRAGGAAAAYLLVLCLITPFIYRIGRNIEDEQHPFWVIHGQVKVVDQNDKPLMNSALLNKMEVLIPAPLTYQAPDDLTLKIPAEPGGARPSRVRVQIPSAVPGAPWGIGDIPLDGTVGTIKDWWNANKTWEAGEIKIKQLPQSLNYPSQSAMTSPNQ